MPGYSLVVPPPWRKIHLGPGLADKVRSVVDSAVSQVPKEVPPDQVAPLRHRLEARLRQQLYAARDGGAIDYYLPTRETHGVRLNASFTVSAVLPTALDDGAPVGDVLAELMRDGSEPVEVGGTVWARAERVVHSEPDDLVSDTAAGRKVEYMTADPRDQRRWVLVTFTTVGDGEPDSDFTHLVVELFDAIMTTWRWTEDDDQADA